MDEEHNIIISNPTGPFPKYDIDYIIVNNIPRNTAQINESDIISDENPHIIVDIVGKL